MTHLVSFHTANMSISAQICEESARRNGIGQVWMWKRPALEQTDFYRENKELLDQPRGSGYWAWKPYIILETLNRAKAGDIVIYADAGVEFVNNVKHIIDCMDQDIFLFGNMWQHRHWCKGDAITIISESCGGFAIPEAAKQVQASVIFIRVSEKSKFFVNEWLQWCLFENLIDDSPSVSPNDKEFQEHRHDQAILTTLAYRDVIKLHWWPAMYNAGVFTYEKQGYNDTYPVLFHHHRRRNDEWKLTDNLNQHITNYFTGKYKIAS